MATTLQDVKGGMSVQEAVALGLMVRSRHSKVTLRSPQSLSHAQAFSAKHEIISN